MEHDLFCRFATIHDVSQQAMDPPMQYHNDKADKAKIAKVGQQRFNQLMSSHSQNKKIEEDVDDVLKVVQRVQRVKMVIVIMMISVSLMIKIFIYNMCMFFCKSFIKYIASRVWFCTLCTRECAKRRHLCFAIRTYTSSYFSLYFTHTHTRCNNGFKIYSIYTCIYYFHIYI